MINIEYPITNNSFELNGKTYDCSIAIKRDIKLIIQEAETSHKKSFDETYKRDTLSPNKIRVFFDELGNPVFGIIIYLIDYKSGTWQRHACGDYYPFCGSLLCPHPYQGSICW